MKHRFKAIQPSTATQPRPCLAFDSQNDFVGKNGGYYMDGKWCIRELLEQCEKSDVRFLNFTYLDNHPWRALALAGCENHQELREAFAYPCALLDETRHAFIPLGIRTTTSERDKYKENFDKHGWGLDIDYFCSTSNLETEATWNEEEACLNRFQRLVLGSGYTFACLPSDGDSVLEAVSIPLDNGDALLGFAFNFYGK